MLVPPEILVRWLRLGLGPWTFWRSVRVRREDDFLARRVSQHLVDLENPAQRTPRGAVFVPQNIGHFHALRHTENVNLSAFGATVLAVGIAAGITSAPRQRNEGEKKAARVGRSEKK